MDEPDSKNGAERSANVERERRILDAATRLIVHYGFDKTTVGEIAHEAGVSKGAVYLHWPGKDDLFKALLLREMVEFTSEWLALIEEDPKGGQLAALYRHSLIVIERRPLLKALMTQDKRVLGDFFRRQDTALFARRNGFSLEFVRLLQSVNVVRPDLDPKQVAYMLNCLKAGMVYVDELMPSEDILPLDEAVNTVADFVQRAFAPEGGGDSEAGKQVIRSIASALQERWAKGELI